MRLLAVVSGELEANMWRRILLWLRHQHLGAEFAARDGEPSATGVAISAACNVSTVISLPESAFSGLLSLRVHESTRTSSTCYAGLVLFLVRFASCRLTGR